MTFTLRQVGIVDVTMGTGVTITEPANLYGCTLGDAVFVGPFVEIQKHVSIGARTRVQSHSFICEFVAIGSDCFVGHGVMFTNDRYPRATNNDGTLQGESDWSVEITRVKRGASIGTHATIISGITIGEHALVGAGAVVTKSVPDFAVVAGVPAHVIGDTRTRG